MGGRLGDVLKAELASEERRWREFRAAVAFVKRGGVEHVAAGLTAFADRGTVRIAVGVDLLGTSREGLQALLDAVTANGGEVWVFHNEHPARPTFHPKLYVFKKPGAALLILGSGNLTPGGLFTNYEAGIVIELALDRPDDAAVLAQAEASLDGWMGSGGGLARPLTEDFLRQLEEQGLVASEARARGDELPDADRASGEADPPTSDVRPAPLFGRVAVPPAPPRPARGQVPSAPAAAGAAAVADAGGAVSASRPGRRHRTVPSIGAHPIPRTVAWRLLEGLPGT